MGETQATIQEAVVVSALRDLLGIAMPFSSIVPAVFAFVGVVAGACLQYLFTRYLDQQKHHRELRTAAYTDYLKTVSEHANLRRNRESPDGRDLGFRTADAKCRICLYGSSAVIEAFARFERLGATMATPEQSISFTRMVSLMRNDSSRGEVVGDAELQTVLLGHPRDAT